MVKRDAPFTADFVSLGGLGGSIIVRVFPCGSVADRVLRRFS